MVTDELTLPIFMPNYVFCREDKPNIVKEEFYHMGEAPPIGAIIEDRDGHKWRRIATKPQAAIDTKTDPYSAKDFVKATNKPGTLGDLYDRAAEASARREDKEGVGCDPIQQKFFDNYAKRRKGNRHPEERRRKALKDLKAKGISVDYGE